MQTNAELLRTSTERGSAYMDTNRVRIPPGPQEKYRSSEDLLQWMAHQFDAFGDTFKASVHGVSIYATRDVDFAHYVLVENWQNYVKGQSIARVALLLGNGLMVSKGDLWKRQRKMIQPAFIHETVARSVELISSVNARLLKKWQMAADKNEGVNVTRDVSSMALEVVLRFIFGEDYEALRTHFDLLNAESSRNIQFAYSFRELGKVILQTIEQRRERQGKQDDILEMLMQARSPQDGELMPDHQLIDEILTLIVAGHETTASTLNWCWYLLSQHPDVERKLADELDALRSMPPTPNFNDLARFVYTKDVVEETMRLYPAGWVLTRKALQDDRLGEYYVPAGTEVYIPPYFIQRHPALWENPDGFDPDRFRHQKQTERQRLGMIPFSVGPRNCIGAHFARIEMQIHLMTIASALRLRYRQSQPIELDAGVNLRSKYDFIMYPEVKTRPGWAGKPA